MNAGHHKAIIIKQEILTIIIMVLTKCDIDNVCNTTDWGGTKWLYDDFVMILRRYIYVVKPHLDVNNGAHNITLWCTCIFLYYKPLSS